MIPRAAVLFTHHHGDLGVPVLTIDFDGDIVTESGVEIDAVAFAAEKGFAVGWTSVEVKLVFGDEPDKALTIPIDPLLKLGEVPFKVVAVQHKGRTMMAWTDKARDQVGWILETPLVLPDHRLAEA